MNLLLQTNRIDATIRLGKTQPPLYNRNDHRYSLFDTSCVDTDEDETRLRPLVIDSIKSDQGRVKRVISRF